MGKCVIVQKGGQVNLPTIIAMQFLDGVGENIVKLYRPVYRFTMHSCTPSKNCMAMIGFYILLIDCVRQVYY